MARVTAPLMSVAASGTIGDALTYAKWHGRQYVRKRVIPDNPQSPGQTGTRVMLAYLSEIFASLTTEQKLTWTDLAQATDISKYNAFIAHNLDRWQLNKGPTRAHPAAETHNSLTPGNISATGHKGYASISGTPHFLGAVHAVGVCIYRNSIAPSKNWAQCIAAFPVIPDNIWHHTDSPLDPGTYHYKIAYFSDDGLLGVLSTADTTATVT